MSPGQVLGILWRRLWIAAITLFSALGVAGAILLFVPGRYDAVATASIDPGRADPMSGPTGSSSSFILLMQGNLISLAQSERVALAVVKQLGLTGDPQYQSTFRASEAFGRIPIENWIADQLLLSLDAKFAIGANVLNIKFKSDSAIRSALAANAFLAATIDAAIEMKVAASEQTASWFGPQIESVRNELAQSRRALQKYQQDSSMLAPLASGDSENSQLMAVTQDLSTAQATLASLQSRKAALSTDTASDPNDPDLQVLSALKGKVASTQADIQALKSALGERNPKVVADSANLTSLQAQVVEQTNKMREHLAQRIDAQQTQIRSLEAARKAALQTMIDVQARRDKLAELQRDVQFRQDQLDSEEKAAFQERLHSKLNFSDVAILDKATPPASPAFPKPLITLAVAVSAGLALGLLLSLIAESLDRRVRYIEDLADAASAPVLGRVSVKRAPFRRALSGFRAATS